MSIDVQQIRENVAWPRVIHVSSVSSTNSYILDHEPDDGTVIIADEQTAGRGRLGRVWRSPKGAQFICSVGLMVKDLTYVGLLPLVTGLAMTDVIKPAVLKWPNDVLIDGKKLAGILVEARDNPLHVVLGFGINTAMTTLPVPTATSLALEGIEFEPTEFATNILSALYRRVAAWRAGELTALMDDYRRVCSSIGMKVRLDTPAGPVEGTVDTVADDGRILIGGTAYSAGDVTHLRPRG